MVGEVTTAPLNIVGLYQFTGDHIIAYNSAQLIDQIKRKKPAPSRKAGLLR